MGWMKSAFGWATGFEVHKRNVAFIKGEQNYGPVKIKAPQVGSAWFWTRMQESSTKLVDEHGPDWWRKRIFGMRLGVILIFALWLVPSLWLIGSGIYGFHHRIMARAEVLKAEQRQRREAREAKAKTTPATPAPVTPENGGKP